MWYIYRLQRICAARPHGRCIGAQIIFLILPTSPSGTSRVIKGFDYVRLVRLLRVTPLLKRVMPLKPA